MNNGGDAADQMVRESIQVTESVVKLSALGAKNLMAIALALAKDNPKMRGKTNLDRLLQDERDTKVFSIKACDLEKFHSLAKEYGVLFTAVKSKDKSDQMIDVIAKAGNISQLNRIFERMGYPAPKEKVVARKKDQTRHPQENASTMRGHGVPDANQTIATERPSVKAAIRSLKAAAKAAEQVQDKVQEAIPAKEER